jgi:ABC-2 type transport system permease protein
MRKVLAVARTEYRQVVATKSFLLSLLFPLLIYGGMFAASIFFGDRTDLRDRVLLVADQTGELVGGIREANRERNRSDAVERDGRQVGPRFVIESYAGPGLGDRKALLVELSEQVRTGDAFAFAIIGRDYLAVDGGSRDFLEYYSDSPTFTRLPDWFARTTRELVEERRFQEAGYDQREINRLASHNALGRFGLPEVDAEGRLIEPAEENRLAAFFIPFGLVMLIFVSIQMMTPILLNSVIEEKMQRISEVLLSSLTPFQMLFGKLMAGVAVGLTFSAVYLLSLSLSLRYFEKLEWIPDGTYFWFFVFLLTGMFAFGSLFAGVSSACQDIKDSQNFAGTVLLILLVPMMLSLVIIESPDGPFAVTLSLIPLFSTLSMVTRVAIPPGPPEWQVFLSLGLNILFTFLVVWGSSRIFRIGILSQGKAPTWRELFRWMFQRG